MGKRFYFTTIALFLFCWVSAQNWHADAGLIRPYQATVTVSSGKNAAYITDGNPRTYWESANPLPNNYIHRKDLNFFLHPGLFSVSPSYHAFSAAFDGNTDSHFKIPGGRWNIQLHAASPLLLLSLKADIADTLYLILETTDHKTEKFVYPPSRNFQILRFQPQTGVKFKAIRLQSHQPFQLYEMAGLQHLPQEYVIFDLGKAKDIGWISSRHLNTSSVVRIGVWTSSDRSHWQKLTGLNPKAIPFLYRPLSQTVKARFVKVLFTLPLQNYQKAALWEFAIYSKNGPYGPRPAARPSHNTFAKAFGINTVWGWGYSVYSDQLKPHTGPQKFIAISKNLRSYERLDWDMVTPQDIPDYEKMASGAGTPAKKWLNWDREYQNWKNNGFKIDISLEFKQENFPDTLWKNPYRESYAFGREYAQHFFEDHHLVNMIEIGNEPWDYPPALYRKILSRMNAGMKSVSRVKVIPCAVQAYDPQKSDNNYIANYIDPSTRNIDGLNTHIYSYVFQEDGTRTAVNPEDPRSEVWSLANLLRFRDRNLPGKPVYVTEFGFDSNGAGEDCTHSECVSEKVQAIYAVRMAMILWRLGARQFYWYFFANVAYDSFLHNRSGLCGSYKTGFRPKLAFKYFYLLQQTIGNDHFVRIIREDKEVYAYLLKNYKTGQETIIAWRPTSSRHFILQRQTITVPGKVSKVLSLPDNQPLPYSHQENKLQIELSGNPVLIQFNR
jgi:hypothetical protein